MPAAGSAREAAPAIGFHSVAIPSSVHVALQNAAGSFASGQIRRAPRPQPPKKNAGEATGKGF
jgi:hypothetical protein